MEVLDRILKILGAILTHIAVKELALPYLKNPSQIPVYLDLYGNPARSHGFNSGMLIGLDVAIGYAALQA